MTGLIKIATSAVVSNDFNVDAAFEIELSILSGLDNRKLRKGLLKGKDQAQTSAIKRKGIRVDGKLVQLSSEQLRHPYSK